MYGPGNVAQAIRDTQREVHRIAREHGWWDEPRNQGECIALTHSELSEALEALRHGRPVSDHIPPIGLLEEELADVIIRVLDFAEGNGLDIAEALVSKIEFNRHRSYRHGGKKF